ncbi:MAG: hypothetical protein HYW79_00035 [Parcubacteria group bacterium]|nr:hypothetical protein [Parcubacteria group bacterium]
MTKKESDAVLAIMPYGSKHKLMIGVLASQNTIRGGQNSRPNLYPTAKDIAEIFTDHPRALNLMHYNTRELSTLYDQMVEATDISGPNLHGFQLNIAWPDIHALENYRRRHWDMKIVLQVGHNAFEQIGYYPDALAKKLEEYHDLVDYILLDQSSGLGKALDTNIAKDYLDALAAEKFRLGLGVAGGLNLTALHLVSPLAFCYPSLCIDAEKQLRDENDRLNLWAAKEYVSRALTMFANLKYTCQNARWDINTFYSSKSKDRATEAMVRVFPHLKDRGDGTPCLDCEIHYFEKVHLIKDRFFKKMLE